MDEKRTQASLDAEAELYFRWRWCPACKTEMVTEEEVPPYSWVHDHDTGEHLSRPR